MPRSRRRCKSASRRAVACQWGPLCRYGALRSRAIAPAYIVIFKSGMAAPSFSLTATYSKIHENVVLSGLQIGIIVSIDVRQRHSNLSRGLASPVAGGQFRCCLQDIVPKGETSLVRLKLRGLFLCHQQFVALNRIPGRSLTANMLFFSTSQRQRAKGAWIHRLRVSLLACQGRCDLAMDALSPSISLWCTLVLIQTPDSAAGLVIDFWVRSSRGSGSSPSSHLAMYSSLRPTPTREYQALIRARVYWNCKGQSHMQDISTTHGIKIEQMCIENETVTVSGIVTWGV